MPNETNTTDTTPVPQSPVTGRPWPPPPIPNAAELLQQMAERQGVTHTSNIEHLEGCLEDLWESDEEFERFLEFIRESRRRG